MLELDVVLGDITAHAADAIVNAAGPQLRGRGGVDGAIHQAGGLAIQRECATKYPKGLHVGDAGWTTAGALSARFVIHTVGPDQQMGQRDPKLLASCFRRVLEVVDGLGVRTVAAPLVGAGLFEWEDRVVADVALSVALKTVTRVREMCLVVRDEGVRETVESVLCQKTPLRILQGVRELDRRGFHDVRAVPSISPSGMHWRITIAELDDFDHRERMFLSEGADRTISYSTGGLATFADIRVTATTDPGEVASAILRAVPGQVADSSDPEYTAWFGGLVRLIQLTDFSPSAYSDSDLPGERWQLGWDGLTYPAPPPYPGGDAS